MAERELTPLLKVYRAVRRLELPALFLGLFGAALGHRWGAYLLIANLVVQIGAHIVLGLAAYDEVMTRPWPQVEPLADDAWDD